MPDKQYDIIFLGGGPAGYQGAIRAAQLGLKAAVVEGRDVGGVCLNRGCIPTKTIKASADVLYKARHAGGYGVIIENAAPDIAAIIKRKNKAVDLIRGGVEKLFRAYGIALYRGQGTFQDAQTISVRMETGESVLKAPRALIATGSRPFLPPPLDKPEPLIWTSDEILDINQIPARLAIVGAGAVGIEMAFIMSALGSSVTLIEARPEILPQEDREMAAYLIRMLKRQKIKLLTGQSVQDYSAAPDEIVLKFPDVPDVYADAVLAAAGRTANIAGIGLENTAVELEGGFIKVDDHMRTSVPGIYAAGDVTGGWMLAHVAFAEGIVAAENAAGQDSSMDYSAVPRCIYGMPEYAAVGLSEEAARADYEVLVSRFPLKTLGMAQALGEWEGLIKLIVDRNSRRILGGHVIGAHASDLIAEITLAVRNGLNSEQLMKTIHAHPSMSEAVLEAAQASMGQSIHTLPDL